MDDIGRPVPGAELPEISRELATACMWTMVRVNEFDKIFNDAQRQGRISFYMTSRGEEACSVASAMALQPTDWILPQYREVGAMFWRGLTFESVAAQLCGNEHDPAHGRQLPLHTGGAKQHIFYVKSTLGTQCPHAAGAAYAMKQQKRNQISIAYFGEGCASEGDVSSALNIAAVHGCPTIFFCRNNGYAISTHTDDQYKSDGVAPRGLAFGMPTIRVDGNDVLAVLAATAKAREIAIAESTPVLIEAMTYRVGAHSTSDDDTAYRRADAPEEGWDSERAYWEARSPIIRFGRYMHDKGWYNAQLEDHVRKQARKDSIDTLNASEAAGKPRLNTLYSDVYDELPWSLREQQSELRQHLDAYPEAYTMFTDKQREGLA
jgi:2-oxoisovalerate dehydrogenase E1 component alpha subunit